MNSGGHSLVNFDHRTIKVLSIVYFHFSEHKLLRLKNWEEKESFCVKDSQNQYAKLAIKRKYTHVNTAYNKSISLCASLPCNAIGCKIFVVVFLQIRHSISSYSTIGLYPQRYVISIVSLGICTWFSRWN